MRRYTLISLFTALIVMNTAGQPKISEKKDVAIFSLGYYGYSIPIEALSTIDIDIQRVFLDLGRFTIIGMDKRFATKDVNEFAATLRKSKEASFVLPEKFQLGEDFLTEAEFSRLTAAFVIAIPIVTYYYTQYQYANQTWNTTIKTNITFIDAASGIVVGIANVETSASSREAQYKSIQSAIDSIPENLQYEIRKISMFQNYTRVLAVNGGHVDIQIGETMGVKKGDEYAVLQTMSIGGIQTEREVGLIVVRSAGDVVSQGGVLYSSIPISVDMQLREIPRRGIDISVYGHFFGFFRHAPNTGLLGVRTEFTRGYYSLKPLAAIQIIMSKTFVYPLQLIAGGEYAYYTGRFEIGIRGGAVISSSILVKFVETLASNTDKVWLTHIGVDAQVFVSILVSRDIKIFFEGGAGYNYGPFESLGSFFRSYGGWHAGCGLTYKL